MLLTHDVIAVLVARSPDMTESSQSPVIGLRHSPQNLPPYPTPICKYLLFPFCSTPFSPGVFLPSPTAPATPWGLRGSRCLPICPPPALPSLLRPVPPRRSRHATSRAACGRGSCLRIPSPGTTRIWWVVGSCERCRRRERGGRELVRPGLVRLDGRGAGRGSRGC